MGVKYIACQPVVSGGLAFFKRRKEKSGCEQESTGSVLFGKSVSVGFGVSKKDQANWWRILKLSGHLAILSPSMRQLLLVQ